ncbi:hypothetical protein FRB91_007862 [Serendipita sp. 411]|nr:hypothetical protein FRB91_007862 [Serendipita sp. 411]
MSSDFANPALVDYLDPELVLDSFPVDRHLQEHTISSSRPMSPVPSSASTPPVSTSAAAAFSANNGNTTSDVANHYETTMNSFSTPVSLAAAPYPTMSLGPFPQRAEHSYGYSPMPIHQHNPYSAMGAPPAPPPGSVQRPRGPPLATATIVQPLQQSMLDTPTSSTPDGPPTGAGGIRKRPKYTRSKKGCLTCRSKKIKCDERKPMCTRCEHGHRECTWPEAVLPRRPKGAVRGVGNEDEEEVDDGRRNSIPGSAVSTQFPPSSTTSSHFPGMGNNSPFEPTPSRRDGLESDVYPTGSQFPLSSRSFYPRAPLSAPGSEFYPVATVNGQPLDEYEFPPRQSFGAGPSSGANISRGSYPNGTLFAVAPGSAASPYNDLRRASWDSSAPTDGRRPSWDTTSMQGGNTLASSGSSPVGSSLGLGGVNRSAASGAMSAGGSMGGSGAAAGPGGANGLMLLHSPDPLSPFFRSVQERNLVGNISSFAPPTIPCLPLLSSPPFSSPSPFSSDSSALYSHPTASSSPVLSTASSSEFGMSTNGVAYRKNSYPNLFPPLTIDPPPASMTHFGGVDLAGPSVDLMSAATETNASPSHGVCSSEVTWLAPPSLDPSRPLVTLPEEEKFVSWPAYS